MRMALLSVCWRPSTRAYHQPVLAETLSTYLFLIFLHCVLLHCAHTTDSQHWLLKASIGKHQVIPLDMQLVKIVHIIF